MTDPNRGAYPPERPLAFDGYAPRPRGGPAPVTLILSLLVLLGVGGGVFYLYRGGARAAGGPPEPVGAPVGDLRVAAPPQAQTPDPAAGLTIFKDDPNVSAAAPAFTPPPEQPTPRPVPAAPAPVAVLYPVTPTPAQAAAVTPSSTVAILPARPPAKHVKSSSIDTILADATPTTASRRPPATDAPPSAPAAKHPAVVADAPQSPVAKHAASGSYVVQIGAFSSRALADKSWDAVAEAVPGAMAGRGKHVAEVAKADGATLYRTAITGFDTRQDAQALCAKLTAAGRTCFVR
jgi:hypothetical protein